MKFAAHEFCRVQQMLAAGDYGAAAAANSGSVDTAGWNELLVILDCGTFAATGDVLVTLQDSDDDSTFADIDIDGDSTADCVFSEKDNTEDVTVYVGRINLAGSGVRRYVRA